MAGIGRGINVYYENNKYIVFFADENYRHYTVGGLLFELFADEAFYMITEKVEHMIKCFPDYQVEFSADSITAGFQWLYGTIEDEELPVATELFRSYFNEVIHDTLDQMPSTDTYSCVGAFFMECFQIYMEHMSSFSLFVDALSADESGSTDDFDKICASVFRGVAEELYEEYRKKCSVRRKRDKVSVTTHRITNPIQLLTFEYCRMKKNNKVLKQCANCGRYFIPKVRNDAVYCFAPSPQNPSKPCLEVGPQIARIERRRSDPVESKHNRNYSKFAMAAKRARDAGESQLLPGCQKRMNEEMKRYYAEKEVSDTDDKK